MRSNNVDAGVTTNYTITDSDKSIDQDATKLIIEVFAKEGVDFKSETKNGQHLKSNALHLAAKMGNEKLINSLLSLGIDINVSNDSKETPLHVAVEEQNVGVVKLLLSKNADVNTNAAFGNSPLDAAVNKKSIPLIELLLSHGANPNSPGSMRQSAFYNSFKLDNTDLIKLFLEHGADVHVKNTWGRNALHMALNSRCSKEIIELLLTRNLDVNEPGVVEWTPLHDAVSQYSQSVECLDIVRLLVERGADVEAKNNHGETAMHIAVRDKNIKVAEYLSSVGADVNCVKTSESSTPLLVALRSGDADTSRHLIEHGADPNAQNDKKDSPMSLAINSFKDRDIRRELVELLIAKGANVNLRCRGGSTALHRALRRQDVEVFDMLIAAGASVHPKDSYLRSPLYMAARFNVMPAVSRLLELGADASESDRDNTSILEEAVHGDNQTIAKLLLRFGADCIEDKRGVTVAVERGCLNVLKTFVSHGVDVNSTNNRGMTLLDGAVQAEQLKTVEYLLQEGADVNSTSSDATLPLARAHGRVKEYGSKIQKAIVLTLVKHIALLSSQNSYVSKENLIFVQKRKSMRAKYESCVQELALMKETVVCAESPVTYLDFLAGRPNALVKCLVCEQVKKTIASGAYKNQFKKYSNCLEANYNRGLVRSERIDNLRKLLGDIFKVLLPHHVMSIISQWLSDYELENFV